MKKWAIIRFVDSGDDDYSYLWELYEQGNYDEMANYLKQWDYGESDEESEPRLALYDMTLYEDETYQLIYNASIGGVFALFAAINN